MKANLLFASRALLLVAAFSLRCTSHDEPLLVADVRRCSLAPDPGPCYAYIKRYYYDPSEKVCKPFVWGGCHGVVPFETLEQCRSCE